MGKRKGIVGERVREMRCRCQKCEKKDHVSPPRVNTRLLINPDTELISAAIIHLTLQALHACNVYWFFCVAPPSLVCFDGKVWIRVKILLKPGGVKKLQGSPSCIIYISKRKLEMCFLQMERVSFLVSIFTALHTTFHTGSRIWEKVVFI